jgi:hypothetical protein
MIARPASLYMREKIAQRTLSVSSWNAGIFPFSFVFPNWNPIMKAEKTKKIASKDLKKPLIFFSSVFRHHYLPSGRKSQ